jgi:hypothetical protein
MSIRIALTLCLVVTACSSTKTGAPSDASPDTDASSDTATSDGSTDATTALDSTTADTATTALDSTTADTATTALDSTTADTATTTHDSTTADTASTDSNIDATGDVTFTGTLDDAGLALHAMSAIAVANQDVCGNALCIYLTNEPNPCAMFASLLATPGALKANFTMFILALGPTSPVTAGSYAMVTDATDGNIVIDAQWSSYDATCAETKGAFTQASVDLTSVGAVYTGTFQASYGNGHSVSGSFNAPLCNVQRADAPATDAATCVP